MIIELMICGGIAGGVSSFVTYPLDLARSRLAVELNSTNQPKVFNSFSLLFFLMIYSILDSIKFKSFFIDL